MYIHAIYQGNVVLLRDHFGQQKVSHHSRLHCSRRGSKKYFVGTKLRARSSSAGRQTNPACFHSMYDIKQNKKTATSKIKGDETTFLHLATDTSCLHR